MAGSRLEKIGSIFTRMSGLLRSGAVKEVDKPLWYDIYAAFPPQHPPVYSRPKPTETVTNILYAEDLIRAQFYQVYGNPDVVDIQNEKVKTTCQKFVERYLELRKAGKDKDSLFELTTESLRDEGARLIPVLDLQKNQPKSFSSMVPKAATVTAEQVFGAVAKKRPDDSDEYRDYDRDDHR